MKSDKLKVIEDSENDLNQSWGSKREKNVLWCLGGVFALVTVAACQVWLRGEVPRVLVCYYNLGSALPPTSLDASLCTHINVAFAQVQHNEIQLNPDQWPLLAEVVKLKKHNPKLKVLLSVGGEGNSDGFSEMVLNHTNRKIFIKSLKYTLKNYSLDGVDLDWEFPAVHYCDVKLKNYTTVLDGMVPVELCEEAIEIRKRERQHFSQLLQEIRKEYIRMKRKNLLLTVAAAAQEIIVNAAYDVDQFQKYVDFVNIMTYDYHVYSKFTPFTGLNSPLYARSTEQLYFATLNINYTVNMYMNKGLSKDKIVVGIPTYGHTFSLFNANNCHIGSPASGIGSLGSNGFIDYPDICQFIKTPNSSVFIKEEKDAKVPYLYSNKEWISYDNPQSVVEKSKFIRQSGLRGAMVYSLNADDHSGKCEGSEVNDVMKYPLVNAIKSVLFKSHHTVAKD